MPVHWKRHCNTGIYLARFGDVLCESCITLGTEWRFLSRGCVWRAASRPGSTRSAPRTRVAVSAFGNDPIARRLAEDGGDRTSVPRVPRSCGCAASRAPVGASPPPERHAGACGSRKLGEANSERPWLKPPCALRFGKPNRHKRRKSWHGFVCSGTEMQIRNRCWQSFSDSVLKRCNVSSFV